jgi:hypothetical protein
VSEDPELVTRIRSTLADMDELHAQAVKLITRAPPDAVMFAAVTELSDHVRKLSDDDAALRSQAARRIRDARGLSLAGLADHIGLSKGRADQLVRKADESGKDSES